MRKFNDWVAERMARGLSSMVFFYVCVILDLIELWPVIQAGNVIVWCTYISQSVIQLVALPILAHQQNTSTTYHQAHNRKLDRILASHEKSPKRVPRMGGIRKIK